jgi:hypothetical protein
MKLFKATTTKVLKIQSMHAYIKHQIWLAIHKKCEIREKFENGEYETDSKYWSAVNIQNGIILGLKKLGTDLGRAYNGIEVEYEQPTKIYQKHNPLEINELGEEDTQPIDNQSVTNY